jgi:hypothetical protein
MSANVKMTFRMSIQSASQLLAALEAATKAP